MAELRIRIRLSRQLARWCLAGLLLPAFSAELSTERFNLSTYYPAPSGIYTRVIATKDATLARDGGNVGIGITNPGQKLDVNGAAGISGNLSAAGAVSGGSFSTAGNVTAAGVSAAGDITSQGLSLIANYSCSGQITCSRSGNNTLVINACVSDPSICNITSPAVGTLTCGVTNTGLNNCGQPCSRPGPVCCSCSWVNGSCGDAGCPANQRSKVYACNRSGCGEGSVQCVDDPHCVPTCTGTTPWKSLSCGGCGIPSQCDSCYGSQAYQTRECTPQGCSGCTAQLTRCELLAPFTSGGTSYAYGGGGGTASHPPCGCGGEWCQTGTCCPGWYCYTAYPSCFPVHPGGPTR